MKGTTLQNVIHGLKKIWPILLLNVLYNIVFASRTAILFPYLRTLISCNSNIPAQPNSSLGWSGSSFCTDKLFVNVKANEYLGYAIGLNLIFQFLCISGLGALADSFGRKKLLLVSFYGIVIEKYAILFKEIF
jgi:hypothetical protein